MVKNLNNRHVTYSLSCGCRIKNEPFMIYSASVKHYGQEVGILTECPHCGKYAKVIFGDISPEPPFELWRSASVHEDRLKDKTPFYIRLPQHMFSSRKRF